MRLTPLFSHGMPGNSQVDFIDVTLGPITDFGSSWDKWMSSEDAQRLMSKIDDVAECTFKFARANNRVAKTEALDATDSRLVSMEWCSKRENIRWSQIIEQHDQWEASYGEWVLDGMECSYSSTWIWRQTRSIHAHGFIREHSTTNGQ